SFAVDQIEITKGPSSTFAGRGSTGGAVNSITKQASTDYNFNKVEGSLGTDSHRRIAVDSNLPINDKLAVRANLMHSYEEVPDRSPADRERNGIALSAAYDLNSDIKIIADYYHLDAFDAPDLGSYIDRTTGDVYEDMPVYVQDEDFLKSRVDTVTLRLEWDINDTMRLTNAFRHGTTNNGYFVTGASGSSAYLADSVDDVTDDTETYSTISTSSHQGWQEVEYVANQTNLYIEADLAGMEHNFIVGTEYSKHDVLNGAYTGTATGATNCIVSGRGGTQGGYCLLDENGNEVDNINSLMQRDIVKGDWDSNYQISTISLYLMDTAEITDNLTIHGGVRADKYEYRNDLQGNSTATYEYGDTLFNYHMGVLYDVADNGNVYFTAATADNINGGESDVGGSCGYGGICGDSETVDSGKPEHTTSFELGTKWNVNDEKLLLSAALFYIDKKDVMEGVDYETTGTLNTGGNRVKGLELTAAGNLTDKLSTLAGLSLMESEITDSFYDGVNTYVNGWTGEEATTEDRIGGRLANFADRSLFAQLRYQLTDKLAFGGSATHSSESYVGQPDSAAGDLSVPAYTVFDAFVSYDVSKKLNTRLNIGNVTDTDYYFAAYRSGSFAYMGDARNAQVTVSYDF
ncbi:MAG: TonB-dependent receptor, partial [Oceanobacter sp.]